MVEVPKTLFLHCYAPESNAAEQSVCETSCFLTIFGKALDPTKLRIKLQERTLRCQLKVCSKGFKRSRYGSLHAYLPIGLAVETSQPQFLNKTTNLQKINLPIQFQFQSPLIIYNSSFINIWAYPSPSFSPTSGRAVRYNFFVLSPSVYERRFQKRQKGFPLPSLTQLRKNPPFQIILNFIQIIEVFRNLYKVTIFYLASFDEFYVFANLKNIFNNDKKVFARFAFKNFRIRYCQFRLSFAFKIFQNYFNKTKSPNF
ncbi:hypothetical protein D3C87_674420 [compost metagenome]